MDNKNYQDHFFKKAKASGYRSRSAFKLIENFSTRKGDCGTAGQFWRENKVKIGTGTVSYTHLTLPTILLM